MDFYANMLAVT